MSESEGTNLVQVRGKVSKLSPIRYTPNGLPILEVVLAVGQRFLGESSVGYLEVIFGNDMAVEMSSQLRVGQVVSVKGQIWSRRFRDRSGKLVTEKKVVAELIETN